jgi:hypothetical protein
MTTHRYLIENPHQKQQHGIKYPTQEASFFGNKPQWLWFVLLILFTLAFAVRVYHFEDSRAVAEVQYRTALIARSYYFERLDSIADWQREVNEAAIDRLPHKEPSLTAYLASWLYWLAGGEHLWFPRLLSAAYWLIGGALLFVLIKRAVSVDAALFGLAYYLFMPLGIFLSTSLQVDSLMIMMFVASLLTIFNYGRKSTITNLLVSVIVSGLAVFVRPLGIFAIGLAFLFVFVQQEKLKVKLSYPLIFYGFLLLLGAGYYLYGIWVGSELQDQVTFSFVPALLLQRQYWSGWFVTAVQAAGLFPVLIALVSVPLTGNRVLRSMLLGLWFGYGLFCIMFNYHIHFASYYHAQLLVVVALSIGPFLITIFHRLKESIEQPYWWAFVIAAFVLLTYYNFRETRNFFTFQTPVEVQEAAQEIGDLVNHSTNTVYIAYYYGRPLIYLAEISGTFWPRAITSDQLLRDSNARELSVEERLESFDFIPEYLIITNFQEFYRHHTDLEEFLTGRCSLVAETSHYLIYDLDCLQ